MTGLPSVFVSHGSPMLALDAGRTGNAWTQLAAEMPAPLAILVVSAHWGTLQPVVSAAEEPATIHDFGGFPEALFRIQYPAKGAPWLAQRTAGLLREAGMPVVIHPDRGLDHGAWVPLRVMYPNGEIPVTQLSIQPGQGPRHHYELGRAIAALRSEGVLIIASGSLTHNLYEVDMDADDDTRLQRIPDYVPAFQAWMHDKLMDDDIEALLNYRTRAPEAARAHPTDEHLLPLYVALGAASGAEVTRRYAGITCGVLAMDVYTFQA